MGLFHSGWMALLAIAAVNAALPSSAQAANVRFQGRTYSVGFATLGTGNITVTGDLIFVRQGNTKFLATPNDPNLHGDFDIGTQRYYVLDRNTGQVNAFSSLDAALIDLTTFNDINDTLQNPAPDFNGTTNPLESFSKPLAIPGTAIPTDICIVEDTNFIGYRTDGPALNDEIVYTNSRQASSIIQEQFNVGLKNADAANTNQSVFLEYDFQTNNYLLVQLSLDPNNNASTLSRITAYKRDGTVDSELILDPVQNTIFTNFSGFAGGLTEDPETGTLYLLDRTKRQIVILTVVPPAISTITPTSGSLLGGTKVTISGVTLPPDAQVFFGGTAATNVSVNAAGDTITAVTPARPVGTVDVTVTGSGIATPLSLPAAFTFINDPPAIKLSGSPTAGAAPLAVAFSVSVSDSDGTIVERIIDFGDSTIFTFPADLGTTSTSHTYAVDGVYTATLTVKDNLGATSSDTLSIVVGSTELILRGLAFSVDSDAKANVSFSGDDDSDGDGHTNLQESSLGTNPNDANSKPGGTADFDSDGVSDDKDSDADGDGVSNADEIAAGTNPYGAYSTSKDSLKMKGEIILPEGTVLPGAKLTVGFVKSASDTSKPLLSPSPYELLVTNAFQPAFGGGGQYCVPIDAKQRVNSAVAKFTIKPLKKRGYPADTFSFTFTGTGFLLRKALQDAGVLVDPKADPPKIQAERSIVRIIVRIETSDGTALQYTRLAVVDIKTGRKTGVMLTRQ